MNLRKRLVATLTLSILFAGTLPCLAFTPSSNSPLARREHPRLWITSDNLASMRQRLAEPLRSDFQQWVTYLDSTYADPFAGGEWPHHARNYAFLYAVGAIPGVTYGHTIQEYGLKAVSLLDYAASRPSIGDTMVIPVSLAYDWTYNLLSSAQRLAIVNRLKMMAPPNDLNPWDHVAEKSRTRYIMVGLAFAYDGIDDASAAARLDLWTQYMESPTGLLTAANFYAAADGGYSAGMSYSVNGFGDGQVINTFMFIEAWRTANGLTLAEMYGSGRTTALQYYAQWVLYSIFPFAEPGSPIRYRMYKTHNMEAGVTSGLADLPLTLSAMRHFKDVDANMAGVAQWLLDQRIVPKVANIATFGRRSALMANFVFNPGDVTPRSPADLALPVSKWFRGMGWVVMRTGWEYQDVTQVTFQASPWSRYGGGYTNFDQGGFTINRNGPLAINSGARIHQAYASSTWAANTLLFVDPADSDDGSGYWDKGGQRRRFSEPRGVVDFTLGSQWDLSGLNGTTGKADLFDAHPSEPFDYVSADITRAYNSTQYTDIYNDQKVESYVRELVYLRRQSDVRPDILVVLDRARTVDSKYQPHWLLHPSADPQFPSSGVLEREGKWVYEGIDRFVVTNTANGAHGRLFVTSLLPQNKRIVKIGGPGHEYEDPYGKNDPATGAAGPREYVGDYRVEIVPTVLSTSHTFLHVLEATDASVANNVPANLLSGTNVLGTRVGDRIVVFSETSSYILNGKIQIDSPGSYQVLITDLQPSTAYQIGAATLVASASGTIWTSVNSSVPRAVLTITATTTAPPPAPPSGVQIIR